MTTTATRKRRTYDGPTAEESLVADLIGLMERSDLPPWRREWQGAQGQHRNLITGEAYRGSNPILLQLGALIRGTTSPLWLGAAQAKSQGWFPRKGSKCVRIMRPQLNQTETTDANGAPVMGADGTPEKRAWVTFRPVPVFSVEDLVGGDEAHQEKLQAAIKKALGQANNTGARARAIAAEKTLDAWPVPVVLNSPRSCYSPTADKIALPAPEAFTTREAFAATWCHEAIHSTGHASRLDRDLSTRETSPTYWREELVAELGAVLLCYRLQIGSDFQNHAAYLSEWIQLLKEEPRSLFKVLSDARKAADLIAPDERDNWVEEQ